MRGAGGGVRLVDELPGQLAVYALRNVTIFVWSGAVDGATVRCIVRAGRSRAQEHGDQPLSDVHIVMPSVSLPDAEARAALSSAAKEGSSHLATVGVYLGGKGFWASAVRSFITGVRVLLRTPFELGVFGELEVLSEWQAPLHSKLSGVPVARGELLDGLRTVLARAEAEPPAA